ncbi:NAD(P)-dependent alcohol dehydrogenase [Agrococcus beijingensis]|uniref:NAD(P)-dependent alcohol dehydrogenase n=1 Tax=Agrococcus beijingensis TaxID=3068634 RepID=UPI0027426286|nr:NAD(P)-dependent alcohol dehydrogenase [Agrococcus sp. REN33]
MNSQPEAARESAPIVHADLPPTMSAIVQDRYGSPEEVLRLERVPAPRPEGDQVVVRVHAASIHVGDLVAVRGEPMVARVATGLTRPKQRIPGTDVSGTVAAVGDTVTQLRVGDEVFGWCSGAFSEYVSDSEERFVPKPANLTLAQSAAIGVSASTALQLLRGRVQPGARVLINGASGGLGSFAVQIAVALGADVTGVCGSANVETVRTLGAAHAIDYTQHDFTEGTERYDFILDNVGNHSLGRTRSVLTEHGVLQSNNGTAGGRWFGTLGTVLHTAVASWFTKRQAPPSIKFSNRPDLLELRALIEAGSVSPLIDRAYPLAEAASALSHVGRGHARGTVLIAIGSQGTGARP